MNRSVRTMFLSTTLIHAMACTSGIDDGYRLAEDESVFTEEALLNPETSLTFQADQPVLETPSGEKIQKIHIVNGTERQIDVDMYFNPTPLGTTPENQKKIGDFTITVDEQGKPLQQDVMWPSGERNLVDGVYYGKTDNVAGPKTFTANEQIIWSRRGTGATKMKVYDQDKNDISDQFTLDFNKETQIATLKERTP